MTDKMFAVVYETDTKIVRRVIDTSADETDEFLNRVILQPDETMQRLPVKDFPDRRPRAVAALVGLRMPGTP